MGDVRYNHHPITLRQISATVAALDAVSGAKDIDNSCAEDIVMAHLRSTGHDAVADAFGAALDRYWSRHAKC